MNVNFKQKNIFTVQNYIYRRHARQCRIGFIFCFKLQFILIIHIDVNYRNLKSNILCIKTLIIDK